ncbi:MAG: hypothetical protein A7316_09035 [Candidatus Altiarchaeales archaeon WOR_SM1_86-2]|nr:MAG: hypothetical protein A7316_09035 [Candidatus Altiarchaeales archaeon WOR_SM1_86-2]
MKSTDWLELFMNIGEDVSREVMKVYGTPEAKTGIVKGAGGDITAKIDKIAEDVIIDAVKNCGEDVLLVSEEVGEITMGDSPEIVIFADPLDGSNNAKLGIPLFGVSLALADDRTLDGVRVAYVKDIPGGDIFYAAKGRGAYCSGKKLKTKDDSNLGYLGFHIGEKGKGFDEILGVVRDARHIRSYGSIALSLCYVAAGSLDAYIDFRPPRLIDITAGKLIVEESGGFVRVDYDQEITPQTKANVIAAKNAELYGHILGTLNMRE